jgi:Protein of unknown function (DUF3485)
MNKRNLALPSAGLALMLVGALALNYCRVHQKLGAPAVKTRSLSGSPNLEVLLPEKVLNYKSAPIEVTAVETNTLPADTSFGGRIYEAPDGFRVQANVVLMGTDRTSLHKPQFCFQGQGWDIDQIATARDNVHIQEPQPYDLPVVKLMSSKDNGTVRGIDVYYYVAEGEFYAGTSGAGHMWRTAKDVLTTGTLPRWASVSYFSYCRPGQEDATFERVKQFIAAATPQFQLYPAPTQTIAQASKDLSPAALLREKAADNSTARN